MDWVRARLRAVSQVHMGSCSLGAFIASNSCLMLIDDRASTGTRLSLICVMSGGGLSWVNIRVSVSVGVSVGVDTGVKVNVSVQIGLALGLEFFWLAIQG